MRIIRALAVAVVIAGVAAVVLAPAAFGALSRQDPDPGRPLRHIEVLPGRGAAIGVSIHDPDLSDTRDTQKTGVVVDEVRSDSPAAKAGLKVGDLITEFDGERVRSARQFTRLVEETPPGRPVKAVVLRDGKHIDVSVIPEHASGFGLDMENLGLDPERLHRSLEPLENLGRNFNLDFDAHLGIGRGRLGIMTQPLSPQLANYFGTQTGLLVSSVSENSPAAKAGLKAGDVITAVNGKSVESLADLRHALRGPEAGGEVTLAIVRDRKPMTLKVTLEDSTRRPLRNSRPA